MSKKEIEKIPSKYKRVYKELDSVFAHSIKGFSEEIVDEILKLRNPEITKNYDYNDWQRLVDLYKETNLIAIARPMILCEHLPENFLIKMADEMKDDVCSDLVLSAKKVPDIIIKQFLRQHNSDLDLVIDSGRKQYSTEALDKICKMLSLKNLELFEFAPFGYIKSDSKFIDIIPDMIENKNNKYFFDEVPQSFLTAIADNFNLPENIRNMAFDKEYSVDDIYYPTQYMIKEMYPSLADAVFDLDATNKKDADIINACQHKIKSFMYNEKLPVSCQIDYVSRFMHSDLFDFSVMDTIISDTNSPSVLTTVAKYDKASFFHKCSSRADLINNEILTELLKNNNARDLAKMFVESVFYNDIDYNNLMSFFKSGDEYVIRAILLNNNNNISQTFLKENFHSSLFKLEVEYMNKLQKIVENIPDELAKKVLCLASKLFLSKDFLAKSYNIPSRQKLSDMIDKQKPLEWPAVSEKDYDYLKTEIQNLTNMYKDNKFIGKTLMDVLENTYSHSQILNKYPDIFKQEINDEIKKQCPSYSLSKEQYSLNCKFIDLDAIYNLDENQMTEFLEDLKQSKHQDLFKEFQYVLVQYFDCALTYQDDMFMRIYKLTDLFNLTKEKLLEFKKEREEILNEIKKNRKKTQEDLSL